MSAELRFVRGAPTPEELAAVVLAVRLLAAPVIERAGGHPRRPAPADRMRPPVEQRGPGVWRRSAWHR